MFRAEHKKEKSKMLLVNLWVSTKELCVQSDDQHVINKEGSIA
jgi:hypothetical protein